MVIALKQRVKDIIEEIMVNIYSKICFDNFPLHRNKIHNYTVFNSRKIDQMKHINSTNRFEFYLNCLNVYVLVSRPPLHQSVN